MCAFLENDDEMDNFEQLMAAIDVVSKLDSAQTAHDWVDCADKLIPKVG